MRSENNMDSTTKSGGKNFLFASLFSINSLKLNTQHGKVISLPIINKEDSSLFAENESACAKVFYEQKENGAFVIRLFAKLKKSEPSFGYQDYLASKAALTLSFSLKEKFDAYTTIYQHKEWWMRPAFLKSLKELPEKTQLILTKKGEIYTALVAVNGKECRADISSDDNENGFILSLSSNCAGLFEIKDTALAVASSKNPYLSVEKAVSAALCDCNKTNMLRKEKEYPEIFNDLGWCSWDALGHDVSEKGIFEKIEEFKKIGVPIKWVLIDDGWSQADYENNLLLGLDADKVKFPKGLSHTVKILKEKYGVRYVGVWHAVFGYWNGIAKNSAAYSEFSDYLEKLPDGRLIPKSDSANAFGFYNKWHSRLRSQGIDFIKVDSQSSVSLFNEEKRTFGSAANAVHSALEASAALNFNSALINCMGMAPEDIWNRPAASLSRSSDDYVPKVVHSVREHTLQNVFNSLLHSVFYYGDFDMFWSRHEAAEPNAILRSLSGGPVYMSEPVGSTDKNYILPLVTHDGKILRCDDCALPTVDCLFNDPVNGEKPLKVFNRFKESYTLGVFNISKSEKTLSSEIKVSDIPALHGKSAFLYDREKNIVVKLSENETYTVTIEPDSAKIFLLIPTKNDGSPAILGILEKYISFAAAEIAVITETQTVIKLQEQGTFAFAFEGDIAKITLDEKPIKSERHGFLHKIAVPDNGPHILTITVQNK